MALRSTNLAAAPGGTPFAEKAPKEPAGLSFPPIVASAVAKCWKDAAAPADWNLSQEEFEKTLARSIAHRFGDRLPDGKAVKAYLETLNAEDLALACACARGTAAAWDYFVTQFRSELYRSARAIAGEANARELADSIYADLYGLRESGGQRKSLFEYFHGRSRLSTWLRAVLAQRHVDEMRRLRKVESLEAESGEESREISASTLRADFPGDIAIESERTQFRAMLQATVTSVLAKLESRDRLRLACYYVDELTLAETGRLLNEHEATVSRKLDRTRREVRKSVEKVLRDDQRLTRTQIQECIDSARGEWPFDLTAILRGQPLGSAKPQSMSIGGNE
jgi:RNA polymerase sigma-70 factor, ECF subfamily